MKTSRWAGAGWRIRLGDRATGRLGLGDPVELTIAQAGPFTA
ncbi:MAG: hypothetical protein AAGH57_15645 [Pseudomonadota bacterium]